MAGPGGGGFGGGGGRGFGGGGFGGGGFGGGGRGFGGGGRGFGGPHFHHHGPHFHGGWFFGPRYRYYGGGCLGGLLGVMLMPIIFIIVAVGLLVSTFSSALAGGAITYNENVFQDYANEQYMTEFGAQTDSEDALMIVFLIEDEQYYDYAYIAWCGDHLNGRIREMFGSNGSAFGNAILGSAINSNSYKYSLDSGIAQVMGVMQARVEALGLENSLTCGHGAGEYRSHLINRSNMDMTAATVNAALESFTASTGIPVAVVVEDADEVLPRDYTSVFIALIFLGVGVFMIVKTVKARDEAKKNKNGKENDDNYNRYA